jgi:hypothetical protein
MHEFERLLACGTDDQHLPKAVSSVLVVGSAWNFTESQEVDGVGPATW